MPAQAIEIAEAIRDILQESSTLSYVKHFTRNEDVIDLVRNKKIPFVDVVIDGVKIGKADNQRLYDYERRKYPVLLKFAVMNKVRRIAVEGQHETGLADVNGMWDLYEDLKTVIDVDLSFGGVVDVVPVLPEFSTDAVKHEDGMFWIARGVMSFEVTKDVFKR